MSTAREQAREGAIAACVLATASVVGATAAVVVESGTVSAATYCSHSGFSAANWSAGQVMSKYDQFYFAATADLENYYNGTPRSCWKDNDDWDGASGAKGTGDAREGVDCSGFVQKVWGLRSDYQSNGWFRNVAATYNEQFLSTANMWNLNYAAFSTVGWKDRQFMDAGVARNPATNKGHVFLLTVVSADRTGDQVIDAASANSSPEVGFRPKDTSKVHGSSGAPWEWKRRAHW